MTFMTIEEKGFQLVGIRKGCRWAKDRPSNGQVSDWTSFELLVVKDSKNNRLWCRNYYNSSYWGNNTFSPVPEGAQNICDEQLADKLAFWDQRELAALEQLAK